MTDYEAIIEMQRMKKVYCNTHTDAQLKKDSKTIDALNIGIKAVEQQSITRADARPTGEWVGINEYIKHLEEETGDRYEVSSLYNGSIFCNQCWEMNKEKSRFCPNCGTGMRKEK